MDCERMEEIKKMVDIKLGEKIMRKEENDPSLQVNNIVFKFATNKGDNYASDLFRVIIEFTRSRSEKIEKKSVIVKVEPLMEGAQKEMIKTSSLFSTEISFFMDGLSKMNQLLSPASRVSGRGLYVQKEPALLIIEDLAPLGFRMANRLTGLDKIHSILAVRGLAKFHASSVALCEKEPSQKKKYEFGFFHGNQTNAIKMFFSQMTKSLGTEISNWPEIDKKLSEKVIKLADTICDKGYKASLMCENEFNVINHGDAWVNNMLFKYNDKEQPSDIIFVDFQLCLYSSPAVDLLYFFNTSLNDDIITENEVIFLEEYLETLTSTMLKLGCRTKAPSMNQLKKMLVDRAVLGMIATFTVLPIVLSDKDANLVDQGVFEGNEMQMLMCRGKAFRQTLIKRLTKFDQLELLD